MIINFNNGSSLEVFPTDDSYRYRAIMGDDSIVLKFSLAEYAEIPIGASVDYQGARYTLMTPARVAKISTREWEYMLTMQSGAFSLNRWKLRNPADGRLSFSMVAKPDDYLRMIIQAISGKEAGWSMGSVISADEKTIEFNHASIAEALQMVADAFSTEWEIVGKTIHLRKVEYNAAAPIALAYGKGKGFRSGISKDHGEDGLPVARLYVQGTERNIARAIYGAPTLRLPKSQQLTISGRTYASDAEGLSIERVGSAPAKAWGAEDSLDLTDIYPSRIGTISKVDVADAEKNFYDISDSGIPAALDFNDCLIEGETMTIIFQSGQLAGREFDVNKYIHTREDEESGEIIAERRFELVPFEYDGLAMPCEGFAPAVGDKYAVFGIQLPEAYICDNASKTGASWDMMREAARYLYEHEDPRFTYIGELDPIYAREHWNTLGSALRLGAFIAFSDEKLTGGDSVNIRIVGIRDYLNRPYSPSIELSNEVVSPSSYANALKDISQQEVAIAEAEKSAIRFSKRRWRDARETIEALEKAMLKGFTPTITPISVQTMQMLVGDESLQFAYVSSKTAPTPLSHQFIYNAETRELSTAAGIIQHYTLGINSIKASHDVSEYKFWDVAAFTSAPLAEPDKYYYLYARVPKSGEAGGYVLSAEQAIPIESEAGYYHLLVGILNSEVDGDRSFAPLYGYTEILPSRITTERIVSANGLNYFDLLANAFKMGDANSALSWNELGDGQLRLKGAIVQSGSGITAPLPVSRGIYERTTTYYRGDVVSFTNSAGEKNLYQLTGAATLTGYAPDVNNAWTLYLEGGGGKGADGKGISSVTRYFLASAASSGVTRSTSGWTTSAQATSDSKKYLWCYEKTTWTEGGTTYVEPFIIGVHGSAGSPGAAGPALTYRGDYSSSKTYYGAANRVDVVYYGSSYYMARTDNGGDFSGHAPTDTNWWVSFGGNFESVATSFLLAENANIAGWIFRNQQLESQSGGMALNGVDGIIKIGERMFLNQQDGLYLLGTAGNIIAQFVGSSVGTTTNLPRGGVSIMTTANFSTSITSTIAKSLGSHSLGSLGVGDIIKFKSALVSGTIPSGGGSWSSAYISAEIYRGSTLVTTLRLSNSYTGSAGRDLTIYGYNTETSYNVTTAGTYSVTFKLNASVSGQSASQTFSGYYYTGDSGVNLAPRTIIGTDGLACCWDGTHYLMANATEGVAIRSEDYALRVTNNGVQKTSDGGKTWSNI